MTKIHFYFSSVKLVVAGVLAGFFVLISAVSANATPAVLPAGDELIALSCDGSVPLLNNINAATGAVLNSGSEQVGNTCYHGGALNPVTREIIVMDWSAANTYRKLYRVDAVTGAPLGSYSFTLGSTPLENFVGQQSDIMSFAFDDKGNLFLFIGRASSTNLYFAEPTVTPGTFSLTQLGASAIVPSRTAVSAFNPLDGKIYALFDDGSGLDNFYPFTFTYSGDTPTGVTVGSPISSECSWNCYGLSFDSTGVAWINQSDFLLKTTSLSGGQSFVNQATLPFAYYALIVKRPLAVSTPPQASTPSPSATTNSSSSAQLAQTGSNYFVPLSAGILIILSGIVIASIKSIQRKRIR
jgi:hypothetical protein